MDITLKISKCPVCGYIPRKISTTKNGFYMISGNSACDNCGNVKTFGKIPRDAGNAWNIIVAKEAAKQRLREINKGTEK